ncbi:MAG: hypothetical protein H0W85_10655 [Methylotenera sp.]|nr:hypothetical protein [Methylotenera sp.]
MQNPILHSSHNNSLLNPRITNPDGSDKNFGGYDENGRPKDETTEKFPGDESNADNKPNSPDNHDIVASDDREGANNDDSLLNQDRISASGSESSKNTAEFEDGENEPNEDFKRNGRLSGLGHDNPPGDETIANRGASNGSKEKKDE